jgi:hypothetical protein
MRYTTTIYCSSFVLWCVQAQVTVDKPIMLNGTLAEQRRLVTLAPADSAADALDAGTLQANTGGYYVTEGGNSWTIDIPATMGTPGAGSMWYVYCNTGNTGPVLAALADQGNVPVRKNGSAELEPGDVLPGSIVALLYDGETLHLMNARRMVRRSCPAGFAEVNDLYCIQEDRYAPADFGTAANTCGALSGRLCSWGEWFYACNNAAALEIPTMAGTWEWTNNSANGDGLVRMVGAPNCTSAATEYGMTGTPRSFRCCFKR